MPENWSKEYLDKGVVLGTDIVAQEKMRDTPFYRDVLSTLGLEYLMAGVSLVWRRLPYLVEIFQGDRPG